MNPINQSEETIKLVGETEINPSILGKLLTKIGVSVPKGALSKACQDGQPAGAKLSPSERLLGILSFTKHKDLRVAQLRWDRFDRRHLPALIFFEEQWQLVEHGDDGMILLTKAEGEQQKLPEDAPETAPVLWARKPLADANTSELLGSNAYKMLMSEIMKDKGWLIEIIAATFVINVLAIFTSLFAMQVYDRVVPTFAYATLTTLTVGMFIVILWDWLLKFIRARITDGLSKRVDVAMSQRLFNHVLKLRLDTRPRALGSLAARVNGLESVRNFFSASIIFAITDLPFALMFIAVIALIGGKVAYVYTSLFPIALILGLLTQRRLKKLAKIQIQQGHERHGLLVDSIQGAETIQATGSGWRFADAWESISQSIATHSLKSKQVSNTTMITTGSLGTLAYICALVVGVFCVQAGELTTGGMIACAILGGRVVQPVARSVQLQVQWQNVKESLAMVNQLLDMELDRRPDQDLMLPENLTSELDVEGVRFSYPSSPIVRLNIPKLTFKAGDRVILLGPIGCGKSTLLKIMAGLYHPEEGQVRLGGADLWELDPQVVNDRVGYLPQDVNLFKGTLKSNMTLSGGISDAKLLEVAQLLGIDRVAADNPRSMDLEINEGGQGLSGGQRQLTALSRVFLARPRVWLLDEPSASLDVESENRIADALQKWVRPTDIVLIATHRPRLMKLANRVIAMRRGQVVADGAPGDVLPNMGQKRPQYSVKVDRGIA